MSTRARQLADGIAGVAILAFGAWVLWQAGSLRAGPGYAAVGPRTFPIIVGLATLVSGVGVVIGWLRAWRGDAAPAAAARADTPPLTDADLTGDGDAAPAGTDWATLLLVGGLLAAYIALFRPLGFVLASTALFPAGAWALGSRAPLRDSLAGVVVSLITYLLFTRFLGLELPAGPLAGWR